jgi:N-formylglutamate amidohydrolase
MNKHICQGPKCHTYDTQSRIRGTKGNKVLRTRFARFNLDVNREWIDKWEYFFCDERCMNDWLRVHMTQLMNFVGIETKPKESPIDIIKETREGWNGTYVTTTIKLLSEQTNDDTITA